MAQAIGSQISNAEMPILVVVAQILMQNAISYARIFKRMASVVMTVVTWAIVMAIGISRKTIVLTIAI